MVLKPELPDDLERVASRSLLDEVFTVRRIDDGLLDVLDGGPRETVAEETFSDVLRRAREVLSRGGESATLIASLALTAAER